MALAGRADRVFDGLLKLLPQEFRDRHGREIVQVFRAERADASTSRERAVVWIHTALGLLQTAPAEHLSILRQDVKFAARGLARHPIFALAATATLALPIAAATAMFGLLNTLAFQPLPFPDVDRLLIIDEISTGPAGERRRLRSTPASFDALRARDDLFDAVAAHRRRSFTFAGPDGAEWVAAAMVSPGWSALLPARPDIGRAFTAAEEGGGSSSRVAIVSRRMWSSHVSTRGRTPTLDLDEVPYTVVGVLPDSYRYPYGAEIWIPTTFSAEQEDLLVAARARPGVPLDTINRELDVLAGSLAAARPDTRADRGLAAMSIRDSILAGADRTAWLLFGAVATLLLIACANVVHLLFVRVTSRHREFCIRGALGANRSRQIRQMVTETIVLFAISSFAGLFAAPLVARVVDLLVPHVLRAQLGVHAVSIDASLLAFVALVTLVLAILFGLAAAAQAPPVTVTALLGDDVPASPAARARRIARVAIVSQVALALVLVSCAVFLVQSYERLRTRNLGLDPAGVLTFQLDLAAPAHRAPGVRPRVIEDAVRAAQQVPGVVSVAASSVNPLCCYEWGEYLVGEGRPASGDRPRFIVHHREVTPEFFNVLGIRLKRGRAFTAADAQGAEPVAIVDQRVADRLWPGQDAIGRRVRIGFDRREHPWRTIVGIADAVHDNGAFHATWYVPVAQHPDHPSLARVHLLIKTGGDPLALAADVRRAVGASDPRLAPFEVTTMAALRARSLSPDRLSAWILTAFAGFGLLLASIGIYGVTASAIERRLPEFGVRMAFGAGPAAIVRAAAERALRLSAAGCLIGITAAFVVGAVLERVIFNTTTADPGAIAGAAAVVAIAALGASLIPAWRAAATLPRVALRRWE
jgi:putative ABC transport system permease protein